MTVAEAKDRDVLVRIEVCFITTSPVGGDLAQSWAHARIDFPNKKTAYAAP
jgi:hypothetical protein